MKKIITILALIIAIIAIVLAALPAYNLAYIPALLAFVLGMTAFFMNKKQATSNKMVTLIFLLIGITLALTAYKTIFNKTEVGNTEQLEIREKEAENKALEELNDI
ncbi:MAG: FUSC family protein, partial [Oceanihabitans sp.]